MFRKKAPKQPTVRDEKATLASILLSMKAITPDQLESARAEREAHESSHAEMLLASTLRARGFCSSDDVSTALKIQSKMLEGDRVSVALDLMEARIDRYRVNEERLQRELEKRAADDAGTKSNRGTVVIPFSPIAAKAH